MADVMRYVEGETNPVVVAVRATEGIEIGDLIWMEWGDGFGRPASTVADLATLAGNQHFFASRFLGVSSQRHRASHDPADLAFIRVSTTGVFRMIVAALPTAQFLGSPFGVAENAAGTLLLDQTVVRVAHTQMDLAVGKLNKLAFAAETEIHLKICTRIMSCAEPEEDDTEDSSSSSGV